MKFGADDMNAWKNVGELKNIVKHVNDELRHFQKKLDGCLWRKIHEFTIQTRISSYLHSKSSRR